MDGFTIMILALIFGTIRMATPLIIAAVGEILNERAGLLNIGIEGIMLLGAFTAVYFSLTLYAVYKMDPVQAVVLAVILTALVGAVVGFLYAILVVTLKGHQVVVGIGLNILFYGLTATLVPLTWHTVGYTPSVPAVLPPAIVLPGGQRISWLFIFAVILAVAAHIFLWKTKWGLRLRAIGDAPHAADAAGINVYKVQYIVSTFSGALFAIAGAYLSVDWNNFFSYTGGGITQGRGFIALALVILANWEPLNAIWGGLLFGFFDELQYWIGPALGAGVPQQIPKMLPYLITILVLAGVVRRVRSPAYAGKPYEKE